MAKAPSDLNQPPREFAAAPPRDLYDTSDIRMVMIELGKLMGKVDGLSATQDRADRKLDDIAKTASQASGELVGLRQEVADTKADNKGTRTTVRNYALGLAALIIAIVTLLATVVPASISYGQQHPAADTAPAHK